MAEETRFKVRVDSRQAKSELRGLVRESTRAAGRVASGIRATVGRGIGAVGFGAAFGTGLSAIRGATQSGIGDVFGEALGGIGQQVADFFLGDLNEEARASRSAREDQIQAFGAIAGARKAIPPGAEQYFQSVKTMHQQAELGRELFTKDDRFRGPGMAEVVDRIIDGLKSLAFEVAEYLIQKIPFVGGK